MTYQFKTAFFPYACEGDSLRVTLEGFDITARIVRDDCADKPDERQDGFWPSLNPKDGGYIGAGKTKTDLEAEMVKAQAIMTAWRNDEWFFCGIVLSVSKPTNIPGYVSENIMISKHAASLWGIECNYPNGNNAYLTEVANDLIAEALEHAKAIMKQIAA